MATAELAVALPAVALVMVIAVSALVTTVDRLRCVDAARATARALARGDSAASAVAEARPLAPPGAAFTSRSSGTTVTVRVRSRPAPGLAWVGGAVVPSGEAVAVREDSLNDGDPQERSPG